MEGEGCGSAVKNEEWGVEVIGENAARDVLMTWTGQDGMAHKFKGEHLRPLTDCP